MKSQSVRTWVKNKLEQIGYELMSLKRYSTELTEREKILELIKRLHPVNINKRLLRLGPEGDGGYLVPDDLEGIEACFSPGIADIAGFELDCANRGMKVYLADKSVDGPAESHDSFCFLKKFVGSFPTNDFITIDEWVGQSLKDDSSEIILQIDIENFEYEVIHAISTKLMCRVRILVVEFHSLDQLWNKPFFGIASRAFEKILNTHTCLHIHPNNCNTLLEKNGIEIPPIAEFTFIRNDRVTLKEPALVFPHPLDFDSTDQKHITLPNCWFLDVEVDQANH